MNSYHLWIFKRRADVAGEGGQHSRKQDLLALSVDPKNLNYGLLGLLAGAAGAATFFLIAYLIRPVPILDRLDTTTRAFLDQQLDYIEGESDRIQNYEDSLKARADKLDALIQDIAVYADQSVSLASDAEGLGRGGALEPLVPLPDLKNQSSSLRLVRNEDGGVLLQLDKNLKLLKNIPIGMPVQGRISSKFGNRRSPFTNRWRFHKGIDLAAAHKTPIVATADGTVTEVSYRRGYGRTVTVDHGAGLKTVFGHLSSSKVKVGDKVRRGQEIAFVGSSGRATGPHLHYEVRHRGKPLNPDSFIQMATYLTNSYS